MITKERLEGLIKDGATIWTDEYRSSHFKIKLTKHFVAKLGNSIDLYGYGCDYFGVPLNHLFEFKEEAEWHKEFGCIERTERLELPTWEEFNEMSSFIFENKDGVNLEMAIWCCNREDLQIKTIKITNLNDWNIRLFEQPLTKENYTLACRKAKELFLEQSNNSYEGV